MAAPMDLNVPLEEKEKLLHKIALLHKLGFEGVAINNYLPNLLDPPEGKKKKKDNQNKTEIKAPEEILIKEDVLKNKLGMVKVIKRLYDATTDKPKSSGHIIFYEHWALNLSCKLPKFFLCWMTPEKWVTRKPFRQYSRISMVQKTTGQAHIIETKPVQSYDLIAVQPTSEETFRQACTTLNIDIITIDVTESLSFRIKRPTVHAAIERGIYFELQYSPSLRDKSLRKHLISNAMILVFWCKGKNVILTSGCEKAIELRGPHDIANLGLLFNLSEAQAKDAVTRNCQAVLRHSESRRIVRSVMKVTKAESLPDAESWIRDKCNVDIDPASEESASDNSDEEDSDSEPAVKRKRGSETGNKDARSHIANLNSSCMAMEQSGSASPAKRLKT